MSTPHTTLHITVLLICSNGFCFSVTIAAPQVCIGNSSVYDKAVLPNKMGEQALSACCFTYPLVGEPCVGFVAVQAWADCE